MWVCVSELTVCLSVCIQLPCFTASFSLWVLSVNFWNHEHRAQLFVFPHQNRALVTEGSPDLVISAVPGWIPAGASGWAVGWDGSPSTSQGKRLSFYCWQNLSILTFPCFSLIFIKFNLIFFPTSLGCSELLVPCCGSLWNVVIVEECKDSLSHHQGRIFPGFPSSHPLHDPSFSLSIFSHLLILPEDLSEIEDGFNPLQNSDFTACISNNDCLASEFRTWPLLFYSFQELHPLILNHFTDSLEQNWCSLPGDAKSLPNHSQIAPKSLGTRCWMLCELSCCSAHFNPFKVWITEQGWTSCMIHIQEVMETPRYLWLSLRKG